MLLAQAERIVQAERISEAVKGYGVEVVKSGSAIDLLNPAPQAVAALLALELPEEMELEIEVER